MKRAVARVIDGANIIPIHKHKKPEILGMLISHERSERLKGVERLKGNSFALVTAAKDSGHRNERIAAVRDLACNGEIEERIDNLKEVILYSKFDDSRVIALEELLELVKSSDLNMRNRVWDTILLRIDRMADIDTLVFIATECRFTKTGIAAVRRLEGNMDALGKVVTTSTREEVLSEGYDLLEKKNREFSDLMDRTLT
jgi:hypothetical protein